MGPETFPPLNAETRPTEGRLFRKYVLLLLGVVALALVPSGLLDLWFSYREVGTLLVRLQDEQATAAADKIGQFMREVEGQLAWAIQLPLADKTDDEWTFDAFRLFRQAPAVTEIAQLDGSGRELYRMSRQAMDVIGSGADHSKDPVFLEAMAKKVYHGPVYFVHESEPHMAVALAGTRRDHGVIIAQVNLKFIWDVVSRIKVGERGVAYVIDANGRLIAHPDISLVLRNIDMSARPQVSAALGRDGSAPQDAALDLKGHRVLSAHATVGPLGWLVFAELPAGEAFGPLYRAVIRSGLLLFAGLILAFFVGLFLARRMIVPIRTLSQGAARIGNGDMTQRIDIKTGDELETLGNEFNRMAERLLESYGTLERKVEERTKELEMANLAKSRFLAVASHDLRQPLHALGLFVAQLRGRAPAQERRRVIERIEASLSAMNELFNALLDVSKLDAGVLTPMVSDFPSAQLLKQIETTFGGLAREKGLSLRVVGSNLWLQSDFILLSRVVSNLVSNAVRYTSSGRILVGCRRHGTDVRIEVWDSGPGIPADQHHNIFSEFYRLGAPDRDQRGGLGLGLAIVDRLSRLLNHRITVRSTVGKGSCFSVDVPVGTAAAEAVKQTAKPRNRLNATDGRLVVVIDDDPLVLEGMGDLMRNWGCSVVTGDTEQNVIAGLAGHRGLPDVIISDYQLRGGRTGIEAIAHLRRTLGAPIPAFLISGNTDSEPLRIADANGFPLLHKPVNPMALRATLTQVLKQHDTAHA
jgi:signal transduction histidine kinase